LLAYEWKLKQSGTRYNRCKHNNCKHNNCRHNKTRIKTLVGDYLKLRHLAIALSRLPVHPCNSVELEQYQTEGNLAALWLSQIDGTDGLEGKRVLDLGAGNGILGHAAQLFGAEVTFVECDPDAAELCRKLGDTIEGVVGEIELPEVDMVICNPPWGVQTHGADRAFIDAAMQCAPVVHMMHSALATHLPEGEVILKGEFRMPATYMHHSSKMGTTAIKCWRITRG
jgi:putative methylase